MIRYYNSNNIEQAEIIFNEKAWLKLNSFIDDDFFDDEGIYTKNIKTIYSNWFYTIETTYKF